MYFLGWLHCIHTTQNQIYQTISCAHRHKVYFIKISTVVLEMKYVGGT